MHGRRHGAPFLCDNLNLTVFIYFEKMPEG